MTAASQPDVEIGQPDPTPGGHMVELRHRQSVADVQPSTGPAAIMALIGGALDKGVPVESLERLQVMLERASDRAAAAEFSQAMADFQAACPPISRNKTAKIVSTSGGAAFSYTYAELDHIARTVNPILQRFGLAYSWDSEMIDKLLRVRCTLRHVNGHSVVSTFTAPTESRAGMTEQQKYGSALSYGKRQALVQVLGLTTTDHDIDGADPAAQAKITEEQAGDIIALIEEMGISLKRLLKTAGVERVADIPAADYETLVARVRATPTAAKAATPPPATEKGDAAE